MLVPHHHWKSDACFIYSIWLKYFQLLRSSIKFVSWFVFSTITYVKKFSKSTHSILAWQSVSDSSELFLNGIYIKAKKKAKSTPSLYTWCTYVEICYCFKLHLKFNKSSNYVEVLINLLCRKWFINWWAWKEVDEIH